MAISSHQSQVRSNESAPRPTRPQMEAFLAALFSPDDVIEIRAIETWTEKGKKLSQPVRRLWLRPNELVLKLDEIHELNRSANIFFGVNPRMDKRGTKDSVAECRFIWADLDNMAHREATLRWQRIGLSPTIVVNSGHGIHAYWRLVSPVAVHETDIRCRFESLVKNFGSELGGDATHDCSRLLRLPGTLNVKNIRNGATPAPCELLSFEPTCVYPITAFSKWESRVRGESNSNPSRDAADAKSPAAFGSASLGTSRDMGRIQGLLRHLEKEVPDRSRRDFFVVTSLLSLGVSTSEIASMVAGKSKFVEGGESYFQTTVENALRRLGR